MKKSLAIKQFFNHPHIKAALQKLHRGDVYVFENMRLLNEDGDLDYFFEKVTGLGLPKGTLVVITHFYRTGLRVKVLSSPDKFVRNFHGSPRGVTIRYEDLTKIEWRKVQLSDLPTYISEATPNFARLFEKLTIDDVLPQGRGT